MVEFWKGVNASPFNKLLPMSLKANYSVNYAYVTIPEYNLQQLY